MFDISKFSVSGSQSQSLVKDFEVIETYNITVDDIQASWVDSLNVTALTAGFLIPVGFVAWWQGFNCLGVVAVVCLVTGAMALRRYDLTTRPLLERQRFSLGHVSWEKMIAGAKQSQRAEVRSVSGRPYTDQQFVEDVFKTDILNHEQLQNLAVAVSQTGKFNQDVVCKTTQISTTDYGNLAAEMMAQGLLSLKGKTQQQGFNVTKRGYEWFAMLVPAGNTSTPLLSELVAKSA